MRKMFAACSLAAGLGLVLCQGASAFPVAATALQAAPATAAVQQAQYSERHTKHHIIKCYREFVVGPYACHTYNHW
jgi:hypothetical protein